MEALTVQPEQSFAVPEVHGAALEVAVTLRRASPETTAASILLQSDTEVEAFGASEDTATESLSVAITVSWQDSNLKVADAYS